MTYTIARTDALPPPDANWERADWQHAETLQVTHFPWEDSGHHPKTEARLLYDAQHLGIIFRVEDQYIRAVAEHYQGSVCLDSCVEFFVSPVPGSMSYFNFEINCGGTMLLYKNPDPAEREAGQPRTDVTESDWQTIRIAHSMPAIVEPEITVPTVWTVEYHVPFSLFKTYFGEISHGAGTTWRANFYKCGDQTSHPHWGSWAPVDTSRPNFHVPASFQPVVFG